jgi:hypothetical protein
MGQMINSCAGKSKNPVQKKEPGFPKQTLKNLFGDRWFKTVPIWVMYRKGSALYNKQNLIEFLIARLYRYTQ